MVDNNITGLTQQIETYASRNRPVLRSVLVLHRHTVIVERYWSGFNATSTQPIYSITKSVTSALVGLALADGKLRLSDTLARWFPEVTMGPYAASVTIHHLLTMTAGFDRARGKGYASNPIGALLRRRAAAKPGQKFRYTDDDPDLLIAIIERAVGEPALDYARQRLFDPLGIWNDVSKSQQKRRWVVNKQGHIRGGYGLHLTTRELASFGQLYLEGGAPLLPADFVAASTTVQAAGGSPLFVKYGYLFWVSTDSAGRSLFFAAGRGGQCVCVVPALDLVMVITTFSNGDSGSHRVMITRLVTPFIESIW